MMQHKGQLTEMQRFVANVGITASTLRNLGAKGFVQTARDFLARLDLSQLTLLEPSAYPKWLDCQTKSLMEAFPIKDLWGPARKSINIFMVMASLNRFTCAANALDRLEYSLEVPLDSVVAGKLRTWGQERSLLADGSLPKWLSIRKLDRKTSDAYQKLAATMAKELGIPRGRLDVALWEPLRE